MNCNPFTRGHLHLIEEARKQVAFLYVFVVEEDRSAIRFKARFAMAKENCRRFANVRLLPSGSYMISSVTFAEYFQKEEMQTENFRIVPSKDIRLFGRYIAPCLGISKRFVGEEPLDAVTRQYNEAMREMLPHYGVELIEIPRMRLAGEEPINATKVRAFLRHGDLESCRPYLTDDTYKYIRRKGAHIFRDSGGN